MRVLFVRHGAAVEPHRAGGDPYRWLTDEGRATAFEMGAVLRREGVMPTQVYTSPLVRAVQTAERMASAAGFEGEIEVVAALSPGGGPRAQALAPLDLAPPDATLWLIGHEPSIRVLAGSVLGIDLPGFRTGAVCALTVGADRVGELLFFVDPRDGRVVRSLTQIPG